MPHPIVIISLAAIVAIVFIASLYILSSGTQNFELEANRNGVKVKAMTNSSPTSKAP